jgi:hypothetical protein
MQLSNLDPCIFLWSLPQSYDLSGTLRARRFIKVKGESGGEKKAESDSLEDHYDVIDLNVLICLS